MRTLKDSAIFNKLIQSPQINSVIQNLSLKDLNFIDLTKDLNNEFNTIERKINYGTKGYIFECYTNGDIKLINEKDKLYKLPTFLNTIGVMKNNKPIFITNISSYMNNSNEIFPKTLFSLMQNSLISYVCFKNWDRLINNIEFMKDTSFSYSRIITKIFDKIFAIDLDSFKSDFISYVFSKFFLLNICGKTPSEIVNNIAYKSCFNQSSLELIKDFEEKMGEDFYSNIFNMFESLKQINGLAHLNIRSFIENYVKMYGEASLLSLDYLPAFLHTILSSVVGGNLVKDYMIDNVAGRSNNKCLNDFIKFL